MSAAQPTVLFLCADNSVRSQLGEALLRHRAAGRVDACSAGLVCGASGIEITVAFAYGFNSLGKIAAAYVDLEVAPPLAFPRDAKAAELRARRTSLLPPEFKVAPPKVQADGRVRVAVSTTEPGIPPRDLFTIRLDYPPSATVRAADVRCATDEIVDVTGLPMAPALAKQVGCLAVRAEPAAVAKP